MTHVQGNTVVHTRSKPDLDEMWEGLKKNNVLLCGVTSKQLRKVQVRRGQFLSMKSRVVRSGEERRKKMTLPKKKKRR